MRLIARAIILFLLISAPGVVLAQVALKEKYEQQTVYWKGTRLMRNGEKMTISEFKSELLRFDDSALEFDLYRKNNRNGWIFYGLSIATLFTPLLTDNRTAQGVLLGAGLGLFVPCVVFLSKGGNHLNKSVWYYNRDALLVP